MAGLADVFSHIGGADSKQGSRTIGRGSKTNIFGVGDCGIDTLQKNIRSELSNTDIYAVT